MSSLFAAALNKVPESTLRNHRYRGDIFSTQTNHAFAKAEAINPDTRELKQI